MSLTLEQLHALSIAIEVLSRSEEENHADDVAALAGLVRQHVVSQMERAA